MTDRGYIETVRPLQVRGWVFDPDHKNVHCTISLKIDGVERGTAVANLMRDDLADAGIGSGDHGFIINLDIPLGDREIQNLQVIALLPSGAEWTLPLLECGQDQEVSLARRVLGGLPSIDETQYPVFILGAARSGTSAIAQALLKTGAYEGFEEGHALPLIGNLMETVTQYFEDNGEDADGRRNTLLSHIAPDFFRSQIRMMFIDAARRSFSTGHWIDKTPNTKTIQLAPLFKELWPNAKFIFARRRAVENVLSRQRKFPSVPFAEHCHDWAQAMKAWTQVRDALGHDGLEIEQLSLMTETMNTCGEIRRFLSLSVAARARLEVSLAADFPERTAPLSRTYGSADEALWSDADRAMFLEVCGPMMMEFGYSFPSWAG